MSFLLVVSALQLLMPILAKAETIFNPQFDLASSLSASAVRKTNDVLLPISTDIIDIDENERLLQTKADCPLPVSTWQHLVVLELNVTESTCYNDINLLQDAAMVADLETAYVQTYNAMQAKHCDPFVRRAKSTELMNVGERNVFGNIPVTMMITGTCRGCEGIDMNVYDVPTSNGPEIASRHLRPVGVCSCPVVPTSENVRAPYEAEFITQFQKTIEGLGDNCVNSVADCGYATTFETGIIFDVGTDSDELTDDELETIAQVFKATTNAQYAVTESYCDADFRTVEYVSAKAILYRRPQNMENENNNNNNIRRLKKARRNTFVLRTQGRCIKCKSELFSGDDVDEDLEEDPSEEEEIARIEKVPVVKRPLLLRTEKEGEEEAEEETPWDVSHCFCPLGATIVQESISIDSFLDVFMMELSSLEIPIGNITNFREVKTSMLDVVGTEEDPAYIEECIRNQDCGFTWSDSEDIWDDDDGYIPFSDEPTPTVSVLLPTPTVPVASPTPTVPVASPTPTLPVASPTSTVPVLSPTPTVPVESPTPTAAVPSPIPTVPVASPIVPVSTPTISVATTSAPFPAPTAQVPTPTSPVPTPTAPVLTPIVPVPTPTAPVLAPIVPVPTRNAPVSTATVPVPTTNATVPTATVPVPTATALVPSPIVPVPTATVPVPTPTAPVPTPIVPVLTAAAPVPTPIVPGPTPIVPVRTLNTPVPTPTDTGMMVI